MILTITKWWSFDHHFPPSLVITFRMDYVKSPNRSIIKEFKWVPVRDPKEVMGLASPFLDSTDLDNTNELFLYAFQMGL